MAQVLLLVLGGILGAIGKNVTVGQLSDSLDIWAGVDPHALLYLFLPLLVFESSFNVDCTYSFLGFVAVNSSAQPDSG